MAKKRKAVNATVGVETPAAVEVKEEVIEEVKEEQIEELVDNSFEAVVTAKLLNIRADDTKDSEIVKAVPFGTVLRVYGNCGEWSSVDDGWVMTQFIKKV